MNFYKFKIKQRKKLQLKNIFRPDIFNLKICLLQKITAIRSKSTQGNRNCIVLIKKKHIYVI